MSNVRASLASALLGSYLGLLLQLATTAYVARVLTPQQTGMFAVASVFLALAVSCRDFGVSEFLIQRAEVTPAVLRASMAVNMASSWVAAALLGLLAPAVAWFYAEPLLAAVMAVQALSLVLIPLGAVTLAWFRRQMQPRPLLVAQAVAQLAQALATVGGVAAGWGVLALAWGGVAGVLATVLVAWCYRPAWFPRWPSWQGAREVVQFGRFASGVFVAHQVGRGMPDLVVGRVEGLAAAGLFSRASGVVELFNRLVMQAVQPICMPYLSQSRRQDGSLAPGLLRATVLLTGMGWPCLVLLGLGAYPAVRLMYGPQWDAAVPVAQVLCAVAAVELAYRLTEEALFAQGQSRAAQSLMLRVHGLRVAGVLGGVGLGFGLLGAALGLLLASGLGAWLAQGALRSHVGLPASTVCLALLPSIALTLAAALPVLVLHGVWPVGEGNFLPWGAAAAALGLSAWLAASAALGHPVWAEVQRVVRAVLALRPAGAGGGAR